MYRLLAGLKLAGTPLISLGAHSARSWIRYIDGRTNCKCCTCACCIFACAVCACAGLCGVETSSSIQYISPRSENDETQGKWFRSELYASGGVVLSENQDTVMCQVLPSFTIVTITLVIFIVVIIIKPSADRFWFFLWPTTRPSACRRWWT